ncbi:MAG: hypothetical protein KF911_09040 [Pseudomonadales bacterium]|nr:hypothetical protein [Pseudomonadales bacterium]
MKSILRPFLILYAAFVAPAVVALDIASTDIAGLRAGMSVDEAEAALRRHAADFTITRHEITYGYSDGAVQYETPPILSRVMAKRLYYPGVAGTQDNFLLVFFGLPGEEVLTAMHRSVSGLRNPATRADFLKSLVAKYGEPHVAFAGNQYATWLADPRRPEVCFTMQNGVSEISSPLMETSQRQTFDDCASMVRYSVGSDPVTGFYAELIDLEGIIATHEAVQAWIDGLEEDAVRKREANAELPSL